MKRFLIWLKTNYEQQKNLAKSPLKSVQKLALRIEKVELTHLFNRKMQLKFLDQLNFMINHQTLATKENWQLNFHFYHTRSTLEPRDILEIQEL